jgi:hypothetical protein
MQVIPKRMPKKFFLYFAAIGLVFLVTGKARADVSAAVFTVAENPTPVFSPLIPDQEYVLKDNTNYKLYYDGNDFSSINLATSPDGINWTPYSGNPVLSEGSSLQLGHADVHFYSDGFAGANGGISPSAITMYYRMWYQGTPIDNIGSWRYAESPDGISWYNHMAVIQHGTPVFSPATWTDYGVADVVYTPGGEGGDVNKTFRIYANVEWELGSAYGAKELVVMAYSANGYDWTGYDPTGAGYATPIFEGTLDGTSFDTDHIGWFKVIKNSPTDWEAFYSGGKGTTYQALNGIGYATSSDGINWVRRQTLFTTNDPVAWRDQSVWMPSVVKSGDNYKIFFLGSDNPMTDGSWIWWKLGEADLTLANPAPTAAPHGTTKGPSTITVVNLVVNASGGAKTPADFPLFVNGIPVVSGATNIFPAPAGVYRVTETADPDYTSAFSGDCDATGGVALNPGDASVCILTNTYTGSPTAVVPPIPPLIDVVKTAGPSVLPKGPGEVIYTYTLRNIGTVPVTDITMIGDTCSPIKLVSGDINNNHILDVNETWTYHCSMPLAESHTNTVVATGWANGLTTTDIASATVMVGTPLSPPLIHIVSTPSPMDLSDDGGLVTYEEEVTNPGMVPLGNISISNDVCNSQKYISGDRNNNSKLDPSEIWTYVCQANLSKTSTNTSLAYGTGNGGTAHDISIATVVVAAPASTNGTLIKMIKTNLLLGSRGNGVKILQNFLMSDIAEMDDVEARALMNAGATGYFGLLTRAALAEFQEDVGIKPAAGYFGPITRAYLETHY